MKKVLLILIISISFVSCADFPRSIEADIEYDKKSYIVVLDSCEYLKEHTYGNDIYVHKGNCKYCEQRRKQELKAIIKELKQ